MSLNSKIEWTDATWNPIRGCTKISPGCAHCYAETFAERFRGVPGIPTSRDSTSGSIPEKLAEPLRWTTPRMVFVNSMSDLFHEDVPDDYIERVCRVMEQANWHTFQVLTKRSERMRDLLRTRLGFAAREPHIWFGRQRREPQARPAADRAPPRRAGRAAVALGRAAAGRPGAARPRGHRLGDRGRRERPGCAADGAGLGPLDPRPVPGGGRSVLLQAVGRRAQEADPAANSTAGPTMNGRSVARADSLNG